MLLIDNQPTADDYSSALTLESRFGGRLVYVIGNASVRARFRPWVEIGGSETAEYGPETLLTPQTGTIDRISAVKFRSAVAGTPARVIAQLSEPGDILPAAGTPFTQTIAASGGVSLVGELAYVERTTDQAITVAATEAAPLTILTLPSVTFDGATTVLLELFFSDGVFSVGAGGNRVGFNLWDAGADLGRLAASKAAAGASVDYYVGPFYVARRFTPAAGAIAYRIRAWALTNTYTVRAGAWGAGTQPPCWARISTV